jgi:hypothetical protein
MENEVRSCRTNALFGILVALAWVVMKVGESIRSCLAMERFYAIIMQGKC